MILRICTLFFSFLFFSFSATWAADATASGSLKNPILFGNISVSSLSTIILTFNQNIQTESLRATIVDQATNDVIKIDSITGSLNPKEAKIVFSDSLIAGASYKLSIISLRSSTDVSINSTDSIREFEVPMALAETESTALPNTTAVLATSTENTSPNSETVSLPQDTNISPTVETLVSPGVQSGSTNTIAAEMLPQTGLPTMLVVLLSGILAILVFFVRKRV